MNSCKKILIANENAEESQRMLEKITTEENIFEIQIANDGLKAQELLKSNDFDLLIVDLVLPEIDGFEVIENAKKFKRPQYMKPILEEITMKEDVTEYNDQTITKEKTTEERRQENLVLKIEE